MPSLTELFRNALRLACCAGWAVYGTSSLAAEDFAAYLARGIAYRQQGHATLALESLNAARAVASRPQERALAAGELGVALQQAHRFDEAEMSLRTAYGHFRGVERARYALDLGNLATARRQPDTALRYFREAMTLGERSPQIVLTAALNAARLQPQHEREKALQGLDARIAQLPADAASARLSLNFGHQARGLGRSGLKPAYEHLERARRLALAAGEDGLDVVRRILAQAKRHLNPGGIIAIEVGHNRELVEAAFPQLAAVWLDTDTAAGKVFLVNRDDL